MEQLLIKLLGEDLGVSTLLILFILGILTKRFVPWWIYEEVVEKLDQYEEEAPELLDEIGKLMDAMHRQAREGNHISDEEQDVVRTLEPKIARLKRQRRVPSTRRRKEVIDEFL